MKYILYEKFDRPYPDPVIFAGNMLCWRDEDDYTDADIGEFRDVVHHAWPPDPWPAPYGYLWRVDVDDPEGDLLLVEDPNPGPPPPE